MIRRYHGNEPPDLKVRARNQPSRDGVRHSRPGTVAGIIGFQETGLGDPAWDLSVLAAEHGSRSLRDLLAAYDLALDPCFVQRVDFDARRVLFHELLYGIHDDAQPSTDRNLQRLRRAMTGQAPIGGWLAVCTSETRSQEGLPIQTIALVACSNSSRIAQVCARRVNIGLARRPLPIGGL